MGPGIHVRWRSELGSTSTMPSTVCAITVYLSQSRYTGKERDTESGNDYFGARYYSSAMGRFMSPDWSAKEDPIPYAKLDDPQSLNLYRYVLDNPMASIDTDGHCCNLSEAFQSEVMLGTGGNIGGLALDLTGVGALAGKERLMKDRQSQQPCRVLERNETPFAGLASAECLHEIEKGWIVDGACEGDPCRFFDVMVEHSRVPKFRPSRG